MAIFWFSCPLVAALHSCPPQSIAHYSIFDASCPFAETLPTCPSWSTAHHCIFEPCHFAETCPHDHYKTLPIVNHPQLCMFSISLPITTSECKVKVVFWFSLNPSIAHNITSQLPITLPRHASLSIMILPTTNIYSLHPFSEHKVTRAIYVIFYACHCPKPVTPMYLCLITHFGTLPSCTYTTKYRNMKAIVFMIFLVFIYCQQP